MNITCPNCNRDIPDIDESVIGKNILCCHCGAKFLIEWETAAPEDPQSLMPHLPPLQTPAAELTLGQLRTLWSNTINSQNNNPEFSIKPDAKKTTPSYKLQSNIRVMRIGEVDQAMEDNNTDLDLLDFIGSGGMGVVFRANQKSIDRNVAVKIIKPEIAAEEGTRENFIREAMLTGKLEHPNIVPIYELGSLDDGTLFYSMKEIKGIHWKDAIKDKSLAENLEILQRVCDAVAFAHGKGIIHRDLKPENVMLGEYGEVMVMDWGLAVNVNRDTQSANAEILDEESGHAGTPAYMAPEMASCDYPNIGKRSDIYLLGAILYEIVGGVKPHAGKDVLECLHNAARNIIRPCSADGELMNIARKAMSTKPEDRYPGVKDFQSTIREYQKHAESIALYDSAVEHLKNAQATSYYELYAQSVFGFKEALKLWPDNINAKLKLAEANQEYAKCAYSKNDLDLAMSLLNSANSGHMDLLNKVSVAYKDRDRKKKLLRRLTYGSAGLAAGIILILLVSVLWIQLERSSAVKARVKAEDALAKLKTSQDSEAAAKKETVKVKEIVGKDKLQLAEEAEKSKEEAERAKEAAGKDKLLLAQEAMNAKESESKAKESEAQARQDAVKIANTTHKYGYKSTLLTAKEKIDKSQFNDALETLKSAPTVKRNIEWGLLKNMCHLDKKSINFEGYLCAISPDETMLALLLNKGKCLMICKVSGEEVCRFDFAENDKTLYENNFYTSSRMDMKDNTRRKTRSRGTGFFSYDSKYLLTGNTIFDVNAKKVIGKIPVFDNLSNTNNPLLFSYDSKYLIARCHDEVNKDISTEKNKSSYAIRDRSDWIEIFEVPTLKPVWVSTRKEDSSQNFINIPVNGNIVLMYSSNLEKKVKPKAEVLDLSNGKRLKALDFDFDLIALSPNGHMALIRVKDSATGVITDYQNYVLWDIINNKEIQKILIPGFNNLEFTPNGKKIIGLAAGGTENPYEQKRAKLVSIYDIDKKEMKIIELKNALFESARVNLDYLQNDCEYAIFSLSFGPMDIRKIVYDFNTDKVIYQIAAGRNMAKSGSLSPTASFCISGDELKTKLTPVFEITSGFRTPSKSKFSFYAISPDNKSFVMPHLFQGFRPPSITENCSVCDMETEEVKARINVMDAIKGKDEQINFIYLDLVKISPDSTTAIFSASFSKNGPRVFGNYIFSMKDGQLIDSILSSRPLSPFELSTVHYSPDTGSIMKILGTTNADKTQNLSFVDSKTAKEYYSIKNIPGGKFSIGVTTDSSGNSEKHVRGVGAIAYSSDKSLVAISTIPWNPGVISNSFMIYDIKKDKLISSFGEIQKPILFLEFTKDAKRLIGLAPKQTFSSIGGNRNPNNYYGYILTIYDLEINEELLSIEHDFGFPIMSMDISPDGHQIRFGGDKAEIWTADDWTK